MRFKAKFEKPSVNLEGYKRRLQQLLIEAVAYGAYEWLDATTTLVPVWSGASRATFLHLARTVGYNLTGTRGGGGFAPNRVPLGIANSEGEFNSEKPGVVFFKYATTLRHLIFNEYNNANLGGDPKVFSQLTNPGPYNFQAAGKEAFLKVAGRFDGPDVRKFIKVKIRRIR